jgi:hypothetical protein
MTLVTNGYDYLIVSAAQYSLMAPARLIKLSDCLGAVTFVQQIKGVLCRQEALHLLNRSPLPHERPRFQLSFAGPLEPVRHVPSRLIDEEHRMRARRDFCGDLSKVQVHHLGVAS